MRDKTKQTEIPGITQSMIPTVVAGARLAKEQTPFDEWWHDTFHGDSGMPIRHDFTSTLDRSRIDFVADES
jgi:hypothetical protein